MRLRHVTCIKYQINEGIFESLRYIKNTLGLMDVFYGAVYCKAYEPVCIRHKRLQMLTIPKMNICFRGKYLSRRRMRQSTAIPVAPRDAETSDRRGNI